MAFQCASCSADISAVVLSGNKVSRTESCPSCSHDLHSCSQCTYYDSSAYNECRESQAERVVDKNRSNFCDYFTLTGDLSNRGGFKSEKKEDTFKALDDLFKN